MFSLFLNSFFFLSFLVIFFISIIFPKKMCFVVCFPFPFVNSFCFFLAFFFFVHIYYFFQEGCVLSFILFISVVIFPFFGLIFFSSLFFIPRSLFFILCSFSFLSFLLHFSLFLLFMFLFSYGFSLEDVYFWQKIALKENSQTIWSREFLGNFRKEPPHLKECFLKSPRFLEILSKFLAFFFWNHHIWLIGFSGSSTCNKILRFFYFFICLVTRFAYFILVDFHFWNNMRKLMYKKLDHCL